MEMKKTLKERQRHEHYCPDCGVYLIGVEIEGKYDGISYWDCPKCGRRWDRFTGKEVKK
jgi:transposase-like protein